MNGDLFSARVDDLADLAEKTSVPHFLGFLSEEEIATAQGILKSLNVRFSFYGGFPEAQRKLLCCMPEWCDSPEYPIVAVTFSFSCDFKLNHRDFLGSLMALGITRESVGDILVEDGRAVVFLKDKVSRFVLTQLEKVGRVGVKLNEGYSEPLPSIGEIISCTDTVSSMRLDCVVAAVCNISRSLALEYIVNSKVLLNSKECAKPTRTLSSGDKLTVRGKGKFYITQADEHTKKGRIILKYNKYK